MVYDRFKEEYIDEKDMDPIAPPERYIYHSEETSPGVLEVVRESRDLIDYDRLEKSIYAAVYQAIKSVEFDHLREE